MGYSALGIPDATAAATAAASIAAKTAAGSRDSLESIKNFRRGHRGPLKGPLDERENKDAGKRKDMRKHHRLQTTDYGCRHNEMLSNAVRTTALLEPVATDRTHTWCRQTAPGILRGCSGVCISFSINSSSLTSAIKVETL